MEHRAARRVRLSSVESVTQELLFTTYAPEQTLALAARLARAAETGLMIGLTGELGAGKTWFTRGFVDAWLQTDDAGVSSPTYALCHEYGEDDERRVFHLDLYRLESEDDLESIGFDDLDRESIILVEWPARIARVRTSLDAEITIEHDRDSVRRVSVRALSTAAQSWLANIDSGTDMRALGMDDEWLELVQRRRQDGQSFGRVVEVQKGGWFVATELGRVLAALAGRFRLDDQPDPPLVGDWVLLRTDMIESDTGWLIEEVLERRALLRRKAAGETSRTQRIAANVDLVLVVCGLGPDLNVRRIERFLAVAADGGASAAVLLTKRDLVDTWADDLRQVQQALPGVPVHALSSVEGIGVDEVAALIQPGSTAVMLGTSGAGKSTLLNALTGEVQRTADVRDDGKGRHTTTARSLFLLQNGACMIDTPGVREVGMAEGDDTVSAAFDDVDALAESCRFGDCTHATEPGCAVQQAIIAGDLAADRLAAWRKLQAEQRAQVARVDAAAAAQAKRKARGQSITIKKYYKNRGR